MILQADLKLVTLEPLAENLLYSLPDPVARNMPATRKVRDDRFFRVSPELEAYIWGVDKLLNPTMDDATFLRYWKSLYNGFRAFDNGHSWESGDWALENLYCAGATLKPVTGEIVSGWVEVYAIDPAYPPPVPTRLSEIDMRLNFYPTISRALANDPFPQFSGRCIHPFVGLNGRNWVRIGQYDGRGGMRVATKIEHPFIPSRPDLTAGVI